MITNELFDEHDTEYSFLHEHNVLSSAVSISSLHNLTWPYFKAYSELGVFRRKISSRYWEQSSLFPLVETRRQSQDKELGFRSCVKKSFLLVDATLCANLSRHCMTLSTTSSSSSNSSKSMCSQIHSVPSRSRNVRDPSDKDVMTCFHRFVKTRIRSFKISRFRFVARSSVPVFESVGVRERWCASWVFVIFVLFKRYA